MFWVWATLPTRIWAEKVISHIFYFYNLIDAFRQSPFFNTLISEGAVSEGVFGFKLASSGSTLFLGGTDASQYTGPIEYHDVDTTTAAWTATGAKTVVGGQSPNTNINTIIDSGTTLIYGPPDAVASFYAAIPDSLASFFDEGFYWVNCTSLPPIGFSWGGKTWEISAEK